MALVVSTSSPASRAGRRACSKSLPDGRIGWETRPVVQSMGDVRERPPPRRPVPAGAGAGRRTRHLRRRPAFSAQ
eukprot:3851410-Prymnesium_polylepis.1